MAADNKSADKSRRERRKEARLDKNKKKFDSWIQHNQSKKLNKSSCEPKSKKVKILQKNARIPNNREVMLSDFCNGSDNNLEQPAIPENSDLKLEALRHTDSNALMVLKRKKALTRNSKTKFEKYLEMDTQKGIVSAEEDLRLEKKLAKKLNVKDKKLRGVDDGINILFEGIPSILDSVEEEETPDAEEASWKTSENCSSYEELQKCISVEEELNGEMEGDSMDGASGPVDDSSAGYHGMQQTTVPKSSRIHLDSLNNSISAASKKVKRKKTKFEEYLEINMQKGLVSAKDDFALEKKLAKKLKVKQGKLRGDDDDINMLFEGVPSVLDSLEDKEIQDAEESPKKSLENSSVHKKRKKKSSEQEPDVEMAGDTLVVVSEPLKSHGTVVAVEKVLSKAPALEGNAKYVAPHLRSLLRTESEEYSQIRRRIRGLLNRLSESNVEAITGEMSTIFHSVARSVGTQIVSEEALASCSGGPRGNEQYAAVFAAFVAGMASLVGIDFSAKLLASLAKSF